MATCSEICDSFWSEILSLMNATDIKYIKTDIFIILGVIGHNKVVCNEGAAILALAWRCLYAELVQSRIDDRRPNLEKALKRTVAMLIGRITAYGEKWRLWYLKQQHTTQSKKVPLQHRDFKLVTVDENAQYIINPALMQIHEDLQT